MNKIPSTFNRSVYERLCAAGMPAGLGDTERACVMACLNLACGGSLTDAAESPCVLPCAAKFAIRLNDAKWSSGRARADGLHDLGLALLGTADVDKVEFVRRLAEGTIRRVIPPALRAAGLKKEATRCEEDGTRESAAAAVAADYVADYAYADAYAAAVAADYATAAAANTSPKSCITTTVSACSSTRSNATASASASANGAIASIPIHTRART